MKDNNLILKAVDELFLNDVIELLKSNNLVYQDLEDPKVELFWGESANTIVGVIGIERYSDNALLRSFAVIDKYRNKSYSKAICAKLLEYAKSKDIQQVYLLTCNAKDYFEKLGFMTINRTEAPQNIQSTKEFANICPKSAICMKLSL